jgi:D-lactate dehydrogenase|tara:strand:- start:161 stop:1153 length:993 start_codon:yes stop_codon:yes gene_type:complete
MKTAFFEVKPWEKEYLSKKIKNAIFFETPLDENNVHKIKDVDSISVFIYSDVTKKLLDNLPKLKLITTRSTGFDHIDLKECKKRKITVCNVPFYGENTVAEHTFALILALSRHVHKSYVRTLRDDFSIEGLTGFDLKGKTIGIIGGGHIGMHVVRMAKGFEMDVLVCDINKDQKLAKKLGFKYYNLDNLLKNSDIISLHIPYNKHTHHLINKKNIKTIKNGAILINTARGQIVDTDALLQALEKGILGGAGLDVIEGEELIKEEKQLLHETGNIDKWKTIVRDHKIFRMDNVVFTPHNAFNSKEALYRILDTTIENIQGFIKGKKTNSIK